jgi:hypothetical protein
VSVRYFEEEVAKFEIVYKNIRVYGPLGIMREKHVV